MKLRRTHGAVELLFVLALKVSVICAHGTGSVKVFVIEGQDAVLNCSPIPKRNLSRETFDWRRNNGVSGELQQVFLLSGGLPLIDSQDPSLKGRVSHFPEELENGNASIKINRTRLSDGGIYTSFFPHLNQTFTVELVVVAPGKLSVTSVNATKDWSQLQCIVEGASQKPVAGWQNSAGEVVPSEQQVFFREGHYYIILLTTVNKTDNYSCVVTHSLGEILHQTQTWTFVFISEEVRSEDCSGKVDAGWRIGAIIAAVIAVILAVVLALLLCRNYILKKLKKAPEQTDGPPEEFPLNGLS